MSKARGLIVAIMVMVFASPAQAGFGESVVDVLRTLRPAVLLSFVTMGPLQVGHEESSAHFAIGIERGDITTSAGVDLARLMCFGISGLCTEPEEEEQPEPKEVEEEQ